MSSTNKTSNYELTQFIGADKPSWLGDYNTDMGKIDTAMKANNDAANVADGKATTANNSIGTLTNLNTTNKSTLVDAINESNTNAITAQNTANTANNGVTNLINKFNLNQVKENLTVTSSLGTVDYNSLKIVHNNDGSVAKIYGSINIGNVSGVTAPVNITISGTGLYPSSNITIHGAQLRTVASTSGAYTSVLGSYNINTDGTITLSQQRYTDTNLISIQFIATLIFVEDFGD